MSPQGWLVSALRTNRALRLASAIVALPLLPWLPSGCATPKQLPAPTAAWETHMGQLHYRGLADRSVIGEVIVRRLGNSDFAISFMSGPGFPLLKLQVSGNTAVAEGVLARGRWSGNIQNAPKPLRSWIALREVFTRLGDKQTNFNGSGWSTTARFVNRRPEHLETTFPATGERFAFHFAN